MAKLLLVLAVLVMASFGGARHMHRHHHKAKHGDKSSESAVPEIDGMSIETIRNMKQGHLVPINNIIFFKQYSPCDDGLKRDIFGVCREVWD